MKKQDKEVFVRTIKQIIRRMEAIEHDLKQSKSLGTLIGPPEWSEIEQGLGRISED